MRKSSTFNLFFSFLFSIAAIGLSQPANANTKLCAIYPHLKDSYWLSVNYGMVLQANKLGAQLQVFESGGYPNIEKQQQQLIACKNWGADAIILGTVSPTAHQNNLSDIVGNTPVFATVNQLDISDANRDTIKGKVGVDWYWMGYQAGKYLADKHPKGSGIVHIASLPGPRYRGGTKPVTEGFRQAIQGSDIRIVAELWADNDKELQRNLVQKVLEEKASVRYIVGSAVAIEAAISELRSAKLNDNIELVSIYLSHGVYRGLVRNRVLFAPTDQMVLQGELSIIQAFNYLNDKASYQDSYSPEIIGLTPQDLPQEILNNSLSPSQYRPIYQVQLTEIKTK
ncbi:TMAO reductase system periplasmic protein TorT [Vibrio sp. SCSIO 43136]|uniref:TMAO reductase system periplasmic protein TorT n=1 Tax=Vibrio sp. SCSIO 43136 TaxID=2819101 RepID=UPI002075DBB3|nr:TMAO reductase system periplasmic protein TorT [Vibrio sp. SCSIO 43136]USD68161.1 TMAO reductase system periplasmic protein TorT [Vibrio sp. SCSIO 43136]